MKKNLLLISLIVLCSGQCLKAGTDTTACNFLSQIAAFNTWDTCKGTGFRNSISAFIQFKSPGCYKYSWTVNGTVVGTSNTVNYVITQNGTYKFCLKVTDTCRRCDTTVCIAKTFNCFAGCNWKAKAPSISASDSCKGGPKGIKAVLNINNRSCLKYTWIINGIVIPGNQSSIYYPVPKAGTYLFCVKLTDTCKKCDTTICLYRTTNCPQPCNFKSRGISFGVWDSCKGAKSNINGAVTFNNKSCLKYEWKVNGAVVGKGTSFSYPVTMDGGYNICVKVTDTCNSCDTTMCLGIKLDCFAKKCNWKGRVPSFIAWDTCKGTGFRNSLNASVSFGNGYDTCYRYVWSVNGAAVGTKKALNYMLTKNGTYMICVKVIDTCNQCDTAMCVTRVINCFASCNWKIKNLNLSSWDTCKGSTGRSSVNAYISMNNSSCMKYMWKVNGVVKTGSNSVFSYPITQNGTYTLCVRVTDTCNACDTTLCITRTVNCFTKPCNFKARVPYFAVWDTCLGKNARISGYSNFNDRSCLTFQWRVNGVVVSNVSALSYVVTRNGTYAICVKVTDTCNNKCDTTFCINYVIKCKTLGIGELNNHLPPVVVYPNPAGDNISIEWKGESCDFEIIDIVGSQVLNGRLSDELSNISTASLPPGIYMVRLHTSEGQRVAKLVIQR